MKHHRLYVCRSRDAEWLWLCYRGVATCDRGHNDTQPEALAAGLAHLDLWHNDPAARRTA